MALCFIVYMRHKHAMLCHIMSCYKLLDAFDWFVTKSLVIFWAQKSHVLIKLERLHKQRIAPLIQLQTYTTCF